MLFRIYFLLALGLPVLLACFLMNRYAKKQGIQFSKAKFVWIAIFAVYMVMVFDVTGAGSLYDIGAYLDIIRFDEITLRLFTSEGYLTYLLNIIMFIPLGFLVPFIWEKARSFLYVLVAGFSFSFLIECSQLLNLRDSSVDDLLMNTLGALIGYGIYLLFSKTRGRSARVADRQVFKFEPYIYMGAIFLGNFFLFNWRWFAGLLQ